MVVKLRAKTNKQTDKQKRRAMNCSTAMEEITMVEKQCTMPEFQTFLSVRALNYNSKTKPTKQEIL